MNTEEPTDLARSVKVAGWLPVSRELTAESIAARAAMEEWERLDAIGPVHGPRLPRRLALRRHLAEYCPGHPIGPYCRSTR